MQKRQVLKFAFAGAASLVLTACGGEKDAAAGSAQPAEKKDAAAAQTTAGGKLKVAFVYVSPANEEGWSTQHELARQAVQQKFGDKIETKFIESVPENADAERVLRDLANQGNKLIFATSFGYMNGVHKVAKEFPGVIFEHATGYKQAENVGVYSGRFYEGRYLAGILAGSMTKSNVLGYVAAFPIPEVLQGINAFTAGARSVNPNARVRVVWTSSWYDPGRESDAARSLVGLKADILTHHTDSSAVPAAAEEMKVPVISYNTPMHKAAPTMLLGASIPKWTEFYTKRVEEVLAGSWKSENVWGGIADNMIDIVDIAPSVPKEVTAKIDEAREKMRTKAFHPFTGPMRSNEGKEVVAAGKTLTDAELLSMNWLIEGVDGKLPQTN